MRAPPLLLMTVGLAVGCGSDTSVIQHNDPPSVTITSPGEAEAFIEGRV